jgi:hypothetical protein
MHPSQEIPEGKLLGRGDIGAEYGADSQEEAR